MCGYCPNKLEKHLWKARPASARIFEHLSRPFETGLAQIDSVSGMQEFLVQHGRSLWHEAVRYARAGSDFDDRLLYWSRLGMTHKLRICLASKSRSSPLSRNYFHLLSLFDQAARGLYEPPAPRTDKLIVISGFDPFNLASALDKSNTSGASVLALHQQTLTADAVTATVIGAIFPVRYKDFNQGIVESFFKPYLSAVHAPDLVMTISQIQDDFKVERFAGRRRSSESFADTAGRISGGSRQQPVEPAGLLPGPEFIETSLPAVAIRAALGRHQPLANELRFMQQGETAGEPQWQYTIPAESGNAVCGSGGGFLSNEIFYRTSLLRLHSRHRNLPMGHFHIPALADNNSPEQRTEIVNTVKKALIATLPYL